MAKCFLTGFEMDLENACILDRGGAKRALHSLKERLTAVERIVTQLSPKDEVQVFDRRSKTTSPAPRAGAVTTVAPRPTLLLRKQNRQSHFGGEHASGVMAAERDDGHFVFRAELFVDQLAEGLAAGQARGALGHGGAGGIEAAQRKDVDFAQQIGGGAGGELFLQFLGGLLGSVAGNVLHAVGPAVIVGAVRDFADRAGGIQPGVTGRVRHHVGNGHTEGFVNAVGHFVAGDELATGRMAGHHDGLQVGEDFLVGELAEDLVDEIEGGQLGIAGRGASGSPEIAVPAHLVRGQRVVATAGGRGQAETRGLLNNPGEAILDLPA